ncbi:retrovirus-related pol polyprotein from transposon TNT 1-94 [Tanacetum coccineum]
MGTVRFGNDNFAAITGYGDYIQGNITICHVYYVEGLGHNLFSVGQFCDGDLEVAFRSKTCYVCNLEGDDLLTGGRESNLYTISISDMAASSPVCLMSKATSTKSWLWHRKLSHLNFGTGNRYLRKGQKRNQNGQNRARNGKERDEPKSNSKTFSDTPINFAAQPTQIYEDSPSTSSIIVDEHEAPTIATTSDEQTSLISLIGADEFNQEESAHFDGNSQFVSYNPLISTIKPKNIKEAMVDYSCIESMQDELNQFERFQVWELVPRLEGKNVIALKWLWKNKCDAENIVVWNKTRLVAKGYKQEEH